MIWLLSIPALWFLGKKALWLWALDSTIKLQRRARIHIYPGDLSQFDQMDHRKLENLTHELKELGFVVVGELLSEVELGTNEPLPKGVSTTSKGIARVFANTDLGCYATLVSAVAVTQLPPEMNRPPLLEASPFRTVILSISGSDADSWSFAVHNREVQPFSLLQRHPRQLGHRVVGAEARELLNVHLAERDDIAARGNFRWQRETSLESYLQCEERGIQHIRTVYENAGTLSTAWKLMTLPLQNQDWWLGELDEGSKLRRG